MISSVTVAASVRYIFADCIRQAGEPGVMLSEHVDSSAHGMFCNGKSALGKSGEFTDRLFLFQILDQRPETFNRSIVRFDGSLHGHERSNQLGRRNCGVFRTARQFCEFRETLDLQQFDRSCSVTSFKAAYTVRSVPQVCTDHSEGPLQAHREDSLCCFGSLTKLGTPSALSGPRERESDNNRRESSETAEPGALVRRRQGEPPVQPWPRMAENFARFASRSDIHA